MVTAILLLAAFVRLYRLDQLPPGLHFDEAFNATEAQRVLSGAERPLFFRGDLTEEPMAIYVTAVFFRLFGASPWSLRLVSAFAGVLTVAALYLLGRWLGQPPWVSALAAFVLAILYWHLNFSRLGMELVFLPLMLTLGLAFLWRGLRRLSPTQAAAQTRKRSSRRFPRISDGTFDFAASGLFLGASLYTYKSALFVPILVAAFLGIELAVQRGFWAHYKRSLIVFALIAVLVFAPLGLYFAGHPAEFLERPNTVTITGAGPAALISNAARVGAMFFLRGDENPRSNLPLRPALDPFLALGFVAGLIATAVEIRKPESRFLLLWLIVMVLPSVLTDFAPHFGRSIGASPAVALTVAVGFGWLLQKLPVRARLLGGLLVIGLSASTYWTLDGYFNVWGSSTGLYESFDVGYLSLAQKLRDRPANETVYLTPVPVENYTVQFGLAGRDARSFEGRTVLVLPPPGTAAAYGVVTREDNRSVARLQKFYPNGKVVGEVKDFLSRPYASIFRSEDAPQLAPRRLIRAHVGETAELIGYDLEREGQTLALTVYWGSIAEMRDDYTVFVHLIGPKNPETGSPVWAQDDARPGHGSYPTPRWQSGEVIADDYRLVLPSNLAVGEYQIEIGMYILSTGARARLTDSSGAPMENDRVLLERISLP